MMGRSALHPKQKQNHGILGGMLLRLLIQRLYVPTLILMILSLGLAGLLAHRSLDAQQTALVRIVANTVETFLQNAENMLSSSARVANSSDLTQLTTYLKSSRQGFAYFDTIYRLDKNGFIIQLEPYEPRYLGLDQSRRPFFTETQKTQGLYISRPFNSMRTGKPTVNMTWPLADGGMMVAELNLGTFQDAIAEASDESGKSNIIIVDQTSTFLAHPRTEYIAQRARLDNSALMGPETSRVTTSYYRHDSQWMMGSYTRIPSTGWAVLVQVPIVVLHGDLLKVAVPVIFLFLVLWTIVALNFRQQFWRHVIAPLTNLSQTAIAISSGDLERTAKVEKKDEIGVVATAFNSMTAQLRDVIGRLEKRVDQLTQAREELKIHKEQLEGLVQERTSALRERTRQLESQALELSAAKQQAEFANAAKSEFLAHMSHEIRTPLNAVTGLTKIVLKSELTNAQRDDLRKVQIASNNLLAVINDILDFSKVEAGRLELEHLPFGMNDVVDQLADLFSDQLASKDIELIIDLSPGIPKRMIGDAGRLTQVLTNLVANSIKFTHLGEIVVRGSVDNQAHAESGSTVFQFQVSDTGVGIPAELLPNLFEPFTQAEDYLTRQHEGTGLGLAICRRIVELMGGRIWAESIPDRGSTFSFTVVLAFHEVIIPRFNLPTNLRGLKVLVADDNTTAQQVMVSQLESMALDVYAVDSGDKAIEAINRTAVDEPFRMVLLDWQMPGLDSIETARRIREIKSRGQGKFNSSPQSTSDDSIAMNHRYLPAIILMVTAYGHDKLLAHIDASCVDASLSKPIKQAQLCNTVIDMLSPVKAEAPHPEAKNTAAHRRLIGRRVLVVEDSELNRDVALALLEDLGLSVETAENGKIALDIVTMSPGQYYDAVLMDIQMPVMDGYETTRRIRQWEVKVQHSKSQTESSKPYNEESNARTPIIALTAHALTGEKEKCLAAGMDDYISKPIDEEQLKRKLFKWVAPLKDTTRRHLVGDR